MTRALIVVTQLVWLLGAQIPAFAEEGAEPNSPPASDSVLQGASEFLKEQGGKLEKTVDETHDFIEQDLLRRVITLDNFFGNVRADNQRQTSYNLRVVNSLRAEGGGKYTPGISARASVALSRISDRLQLAITGENEAEPFSSTLPEDPGNPGLDRTTPTARLVNTELRFGLVRTSSVDLFVGAGFRFILPPEAFVRSRFQYTHHLSDSSLARLSETLFLKNTTGFGETTEIDLERLLDQMTLLRWANSGTMAEKIHGVEWGTELSLTRQFSPQRAITLGGGLYGNSNTAPVVSTKRIYARYRQNFLRPWLYYEFEPEISWPQGSGHDTNRAITLRLEVAFQGTASGQDGRPRD